MSCQKSLRIQARLGYTESLNDVIIALCYDYKRREESIAERCASGRTLIEYKYYNYKILEAATEVIGERYARDIIREIGDGVGYAKSQISCMSESTYKKLKLDVKISVAQKLHLLD